MHYRLNTADAEAINKRRADAASSGIARQNTGYKVEPLKPSTGDTEPVEAGEVVLPVQFGPEAAAAITANGIEVPKSISDQPMRVQLVKQPNGNYGLRFREDGSGA